MKALIVVTQLYVVICEWEVYKHELYDVASSSDWIGLNSDSTLSSLTTIDSNICTSVSSVYMVGGKDKIWRRILMPTNRKFSAIRIELDLYYIDVWDNTRTIIYLNNEIIYDNTYKSYLTTPQVIYCQTFSIPNTNSDYLDKIAHSQEFTANQINIEIVKLGLPITRIFALSNFYLYVQFCDKYCDVCDINGICLKCENNKDPKNGNCQFISQKEFQLYNPDLQWVVKCPLGYIPDLNSMCQLGTTTVLFEDLQSNFASYLFSLNKDKYYSDKNDNNYRIMEINGEKIAGPFMYNEQLIYSPLSIISNSLTLVRFRLYFLHYNQSQQVGGRINLKFNGFKVLEMSDYDEVLLLSNVGKAIGNNHNQCQFANYQRCSYRDIQFIMNLNYEINTLTFEGRFTIIKPFRGWGITDFQILKLTQLGNVNECLGYCMTCKKLNKKSCLSCQTGYYLFDDKCVTQCPLQTTQIGTICQENGMSNQFKYIFNSFYDNNNYQSEMAKMVLNQPSIFQEIKFSKFIYGMNEYSILGGLSIFDGVPITYTIISPYQFYKAYIKMNVIAIDYQIDDKFQISTNQESNPYLVGKTTTYNFQFVSVGNQVGNGNNLEYHAEVFIETPFLITSTNSLQITFQRKDSLGVYQYYGVYNFRIMIEPCPQFCQSCDNTGCLIWQIDVSLSSGQCANGYYYNQYSEDCQSCQAGCMICQEYSCTTCYSGYINENGQCFCSSNLENFLVCSNTQNCQIGCLICGESQQFTLLSISSPNYLQQCVKCDESKYYWLDKDQCRCLEGYYMDISVCLPCSKYCKACQKSPRICTDCDTSLNRELHYQQCECKQGYYEQENFLDCSQCEQTCYTCRFFSNYCTSCYPDQYRTILNRKCECQDGYFDEGISICTKCNPKCLTCSSLTNCLSCYTSQNRKLSIRNSTCICMLGHFEVENQLSCDSCHFSCQQCLPSSKNDMCTRCPSSREPSINQTVFACNCKRGYYESNMKECSDCRNYSNPPSTHYCYSKCGDKIVQWNEDCDDGNSEPKDGCYMCLLPNSYCFNSLCSKCEMGICVKCIDGYFINKNNQCEQCDQSCKTCITRYDNCTSCVLYDANHLKCIMCQIDKGYQILDNNCVSICGDGLKVDKEECDDGNDKSGDGCTQCKVEDGWICENTCERIIYPIILMTQSKFDNQHDGIRNLELITNIKLKTTGKIDNLCQYSFKDSVSFDILITDNQTETKEDFNIIKTILKLQINDRSENPILICKILNSDKYISEQGFTFQQMSFEFPLLPFYKQSQSVISATTSLLNFSKYVLYILFGLAIFAFLVGGLQIFWNLLDVLQLISYLQFFNILYPYNVDTYFQLFDFAQFDFIKKVVNIEDIINHHVISPEPDYKFAQQGYSSTFYINSIAVFTVFLTTLAIFIGCRLGFVFLAKLLQYYSDENDTSLEEEPNVIKFILFRISRNISKMFLNIIGEFTSGLIRTFMAVTYDYNLSIFLQIRSPNSDNALLQSSFALSIIFLLLQLFFLFKGFTFMSNQPFFYQQFFIKQKYGSLYEGIDIQPTKPYSNYYNLVLLCKKILFILFLVNLYYDTSLQIITCSMLNVLFAVYIIYNTPLEDKFEYYKTVGSEFFIWLAEIFILGLYYSQQQGPDENKELLIGWFIIGACTMLIIYQFILDIKQHYEFLIKEYKIIAKLLSRIRSLFRKEEYREETQDNLVDVKYSKQTLRGKMSTQATLGIKQRKLVTFKFEK
ncbi:unnamed protein product [Paramecium pentaurelia]|uniref:EGF-like domain-containing protein n=1 Tax=Paramecium pentaurelia TaxID=43138 RepID=A0A8S1WW94_9CILI|nr:unnamed protein product [Paramecium pentaurelia]